MKDKIKECKLCVWSNKQPGIIFCPFFGCLKELEAERQKVANKLKDIKNREGKPLY